MAAALWARPGDTAACCRRRRTARSAWSGIAETAEPRYHRAVSPAPAWGARRRRARRDAAGRAGQTVGLRLADPGRTPTSPSSGRSPSSAPTGSPGLHLAGGAGRGRGRQPPARAALRLLRPRRAAGRRARGDRGDRHPHPRPPPGHLRPQGGRVHPRPDRPVFLAQHAGFALSASGRRGGHDLGPRVPGRIGEAVALWQRPAPARLALLPGVPLGAVLVIAAATGLAAWRAGRVPAVPVARAAVPGGRRMSGGRRALCGCGPARAGARLARGVPPAGRAPRCAVARLALPLLMITVALGAWATLDHFAARARRMGLRRSAQGQRRTSLDGRPARQRALAAIPGRRRGRTRAWKSPRWYPARPAPSRCAGSAPRARPTPSRSPRARADRARTRRWPARACSTPGRAVGDWVRITVGGTRTSCTSSGAASRPGTAAG